MLTDLPHIIFESDTCIASALPLLYSIASGYVRYGFSGRNQECTPATNDFESEFQRRQDGYNSGTFPQYCRHIDEVREKIKENFIFG
jgi:hypothetical protein